MELYFSPLACSLATRMALFEAGAEARYVQVDTATKRTRAGDDFRAVNPMGQVPVLRTDEGTLLSENSAVLQHVAKRYPAAGLLPDKELERRGHCFVRYADDANVYVRSRRAGERVMALLRRLYGELRLSVNEAKRAVASVFGRKFLGYSLEGVDKVISSPA